MRAPTYVPGVRPVRAYQARFYAPDGPNLANTIGRALIAGGADLGQSGGLQAIIQGMGDETAGRACAVQDSARLISLVDTHAGLQGGAAVAAQPGALDALDQIRSQGQASLGTPGMVAAFDQQLDPAMADAAQRITGHALRQMDVERQAVADQSLQAAQQSAASAWQDPAQFLQKLGGVHTLAMDRAGPGANEDDRADFARSAVGSAVADAVGRALSAGDPEFAAHIVGALGDTLSPAAYQLAVAQLGRAAQTQRMGAIFAQAAGGNPSPGATDTQRQALSSDAVAIDTSPGAAVHPLAFGTVTAVDGAPDNASVRMLHPDGSTTTYGGIGLAAVAPGDLATPAHVIGSAGPLVSLTATGPSGDATDAEALLRRAGGNAALVGSTSTPRTWDATTMLDRIGQQQDLAPGDMALATSLAQRRMSADQAQQTSRDLSAGRAIASLVGATPENFAQVTDLPTNLVAQLAPASLSKLDDALRSVALAPSAPAPDSPPALRLELLQRQNPAQFSQINLAPLIGTIHPADLSKLATDQSGIAVGQAPANAQDARSAVLDALARHEVNNGVVLPDPVLSAIKGQAETYLRLNQTDLSDRPSIESAVTDAIQSHLDPA